MQMQMQLCIAALPAWRQQVWVVSGDGGLGNKRRAPCDPWPRRPRYPSTPMRPWKLNSLATLLFDLRFLLYGTVRPVLPRAAVPDKCNQQKQQQIRRQRRRADFVEEAWAARRWPHDHPGIAVVQVHSWGKLRFAWSFHFTLHFTGAPRAQVHRSPSPLSASSSPTPTYGHGSLLFWKSIVVFSMEE
ncbi:hypothetical protein F5884DRAFT_209636 [Xylogone sp. PMI_703]|nr:hypothetical protein F5884DRAFT_209636 [Xylogone sp. PMI_703]